MFEVVTVILDRWALPAVQLRDFSGVVCRTMRFMPSCRMYVSMMALHRNSFELFVAEACRGWSG